MLAIKSSSKNPPKTTANVLPCQIKHNGPIDAKERYWKPEKTADGSYKAYFRGRELVGTQITLPEGFCGKVLKTTNNKLPAQTSGGDPMEEDEDDIPEETKIIQEVGCFDNVTVWGHDTAPTAIEDAFSKGLNEWLSFSQAMHS